MNSRHALSPPETKAPTAGNGQGPLECDDQKRLDGTADGAIAQLSAAACEHLHGEQRAQELLAAIRKGVAHPDALAAAVGALHARPEALRGLCRHLQKLLEVGVRT